MRSLSSSRLLARFLIPSSLAALSAGCALSDAAAPGEAAPQEKAATTSSALASIPTRAQIVLQGTPYCVGIYSGFTNGSAASVSSCQDPNSASPIFDIKPTSDGFYNLVSETSGLCLDMLGAPLSGGSLGQWTCGSQDNQKFGITPNTTGTAYFIVPKYSNLCLQVPDWRNNSGVTQGMCMGDPQLDLFALQAVPSVPVAAPAGTVMASGPIKVNNGPNCLFASGMNDLGSISQYGCLGSADQDFQFQSSGDGISYVIVSSNSGKCINVDGNSAADLATIIQYGCVGSSNERFVPSLNSDGTYQLAAMNSGKCLNVPDLGSVVQLDQVACNGSANQKFTLPPAPTVCTKTVTTSLNESNPYGIAISVRYSMIGGGGGASTGGGGGGGGSSAILDGAAGSTLVTFAAGGAGGGAATYSSASGSNGTIASGSLSLAATDKLSVFVGGGGGAGGGGRGGGGGSGFFGGGGGGDNSYSNGGPGGGGTGTAGGGGGGGGGVAGGSAAGGNSSIGYGGASGSNGGAGGDNYDVSGGGGFGSGGGASSIAYPGMLASGGSNGGNGGGAVGGGGGLGANSFTLTGATLPAGAGAGGTTAYATFPGGGFNITGAGGNAGLVILTYTSPNGVCSL